MKTAILNIFNMFRKREFKGYTGIAVKNSAYQTSTVIVAKVSSLLFTIIMARVLLPELFGLYSLALGTIIMISGFFNMGIETTMIRFISRAFGRKQKGKAKSYFTYLLKFKIALVFFAAALLLVLSKFLANSYYDKPIFLALIAGSFYILCIGLLGVFTCLFQSFNDFKPPLFQEIFFQVLRLMIIPILTLYAVKNFASQETILFTIILGLSFIYLASLIFIFIFAYRKMDFLHVKTDPLVKPEKKETNKFILTLSAMALSGLFFGYIDMLMLGHFVLAEFLGFYQAAMNIVGSLIPLIPLSAVLFPIFSRIKGAQLERGFNKSIKATIAISFLLFLAVIVLSPLLISIIYGSEYESSSLILRVLSILIFLLPLSTIYSSYFVSKGKPGIVAILLILSTILNIGLNYVLISWLLNYSQVMAALGASIATIASRGLYLVALIGWKKIDLAPKSKKIKTNKPSLDIEKRKS